MYWFLVYILSESESVYSEKNELASKQVDLIHSDFLEEATYFEIQFE